MVKQIYMCNHVYLNICFKELFIISEFIMFNSYHQQIPPPHLPTSAISSTKGSPRSAGGPLHRDSVIRYPSIPVTSSR